MVIIYQTTGIAEELTRFYQRDFQIEYKGTKKMS